MIVLGTELKLNVHIEPVDGLRMSQYNFDCAFYVFPNKKVIINKVDMVRVDDDNYLAMITAESAMKIGKGKIQLEITAYIPDDDFPDGLRTEKTVVCTDVVIS